MSRYGRAVTQRGASTSEFIVVAPVLLFLGLGAVQLGLIYHANTVLNYATFEAARTGATHHALPGPMRRELAIRLAPLVGGDGTTGKAAEAIVRSIADVDLSVTADGRPKPPTRLAVLNPTVATFDAWGYDSADAARKAIPNAHLRHRNGAGAARRGDPPQSLADANLLKIEVTHGLELEVPFVSRFLLTLLAATDPDPDHAGWYAAGRLPLKSVATVRMQSEAWVDAVRAPPSTVVPGTGGEEPGANDPAAPDGGDAIAEEGDEGAAGEACDAETGLAASPILIDSAGYENGTCGIADAGYDSPGILEPAPDPDEPGAGDVC